MSRGTIAALLMLASLAGEAAIAQGDKYTPTGSRVGRPAPADVPDNVSLADATKARLMVYQFADCSIRTNKKTAQAYMSAKAESQASSKAMNALVSEECLWNADLRMPVPLLRGAIFRAAYYRDFEKAELKLPEKGVDFQTFVEDPTSPNVARYLVTLDFADCVVRADPSGVRTYVMAEPDSKAETAALAAIQPKLGPCFPANAKMTVNRSNLSAMLAEALYREIEAGRTVAVEAPR
ncbi:MAG TPA: hypothetical protein VGE65_04895 [Sphingobium sp.]